MKTGIPAIIGIIEGVLMLLMPQEEFDQKYNDGQNSGDPFESLRSDSNASSSSNGTASSEPNTANVTEQLRELKKLLDEGVLTQEEFDAQKAKILNSK